MNRRNIGATLPTGSKYAVILVVVMSSVFLGTGAAVLSKVRSQESPGEPIRSNGRRSVHPDPVHGSRMVLPGGVVSPPSDGSTISGPQEAPAETKNTSETCCWEVYRVKRGNALTAGNYELLGEGASLPRLRMMLARLGERAILGDLHVVMAPRERQGSARRACSGRALARRLSPGGGLGRPFVDGPRAGCRSRPRGSYDMGIPRPGDDTMSRLRRCRPVLAVAILTACSGSETGGRAERAPLFKTRFVDLGEVAEGHIAKARFGLANPTSDPVRMTSLVATCGCASIGVCVDRDLYEANAPSGRAVFVRKGPEENARAQPVLEIPLPPRSTGYVDLKIDTEGRGGENRIGLHVWTSDVALIKLAARLRVRPRFKCTPEEVLLEKADWRKQASFSFSVESAEHPDFEITGVESAPAKMTVTYHRTQEEGRKRWVVQCRYGPELTHMDQGGSIVLSTSVDRKTVSLPVRVKYEDVLRVEPGTFVPLGVLKPGAAASVQILLRALDGHSLEAATVRPLSWNTGNDRVRVARSASANGSAVELVVQVRPREQDRLVVGSLAVDTKHPHIGTLVFRFVGRVQDGSE